MQYPLLTFILIFHIQILPMKGDSFVPLKAVGKGKFGLVYLCKHKNTSKHVAIKYIPMKIILECDASRRLQLEIDVLQRVDNPFIGADDFSSSVP